NIEKQQQQQSNHSDWKIVLAILSCLGLVVMFDETMILPAIPDFIRDFTISYSTSTWILSSYIIAGAVMTPIAGKLADIYGKKKILLIIMAFYALGILSGRFSHNIEFMIASRISQGVGLAMFPIAFGIIREILPNEKLAIGQTIFGSTFSGGAVVGIVVGATIIQNFGWQATFFSIIPVAVALWIIIWRFVHIGNSKLSRDLDKSSINESNSDTKLNDMDISDIHPNNKSLSNIQKIDLKGILALTVTIISFLAGITLLETNSVNTNYNLVTLFSISLLSIVVFIAIEKKASMPLLDLKLMANKFFISPVIILMLVSMSIFMVYQTIPVMVRSPQPLGFGGDAMATANVQVPFMIVLLIGTILSGFLLNKVGNARLLVLGTILSTIGFFSLIAFHSAEEMVTIGLVIISSGLALSIAGVFNVILVSVPMQVTGIALGMTMLLNLVGMSVGPALAGVFQQMNQGVVPGIQGLFPNSNAYNMIFIAAMLMSLVSVVMASIVARKKTNTTTISNTVSLVKKDNKNLNKNSD
ncbi:MAG: MFS transporter, partial [Candidatus Nitrosocosmicus sp.]